VHATPGPPGPLDLHLLAEGKHEHLGDALGAQLVDGGVAFSVWAPDAEAVSVIGDWNFWDPAQAKMEPRGDSGVWTCVVPKIGAGALYKFSILGKDGHRREKCDPVARAMEMPPRTAARVFSPSYQFTDQAWLDARAKRDPLRSPLSIYEVHLGSWRRSPERPHESLDYRTLAHLLGDHVTAMGFTHVELLPILEHPFTGSWGYQVSGYFAPTARHGSPDDLAYFVDHLHGRGIGVLCDWVPAHFPKDDFALGRFDGTALYEHLDPRRGEHPDWGTFIFNYGRNEVRAFLLSSAMQLIERYHFDGLRVDAVASMLYLDYSRQHGEWTPNAHGGRENLEAVSFLKELNERMHARFPGVLMVAEESTAWPGVSRPTYVGGLGFTMKWNMGWMHDTLDYFRRDPVHRRFHHRNLTFSSLYAYSENFILPLSHDEVVHGKGSLLSKMPGDRWQKLANLRSLYGFMWAHSGKKLLFMGGELAQDGEWNHDRSLDWHLLEDPDHAGMMRLIADLNGFYRATPALWAADIEPSGTWWIEADNADDNALAFMRVAPQGNKNGNGSDMVACIFNFSPVVRYDHHVGLPRAGRWREAINTDSAHYGGGNVGNAGEIDARFGPWHGQPASARIVLPPLAAVYLVPV
jgi:1,4-alpha-glucan branching enzyme